MRFQQKVRHLTKTIPRGRVSTYQEIARAMKTKAYRAVGNALHRNQNSFCYHRNNHNDSEPAGNIRRPQLVPCHRVVLSNGKMGGFAKGTAMKARLLRQEGISVRNNRIVDFRKRLFRFGKV